MMMHQLILVLCLVSVLFTAQGAMMPRPASTLFLMRSGTNSSPIRKMTNKEDRLVQPTSLLVASSAADVSLTGSVVTAPKSKFRQTLKQVLPILASAFCAAAIMYPLDVVRSLQMANAGSGLTTKELLVNFHKAHGFKGFFTQGLVPELARSTWMRFIKFALFPMVHMSLTGLPDSKGNELTKAAAAIVSSIPEALSIMPLEISKIALQLDTKNLYRNNMFRAMQKVYSEQGGQGFMVGYFGVQYRQAAWSAGYFASIKFFEKHVQQLFAKAELDKKYPKAVKTASQLLSGFLAGVFGACLNTPGDTIRSTLQKKVLSQYGNPQALAQAMSSLTFLGVGRDIVAAKGVGALYAGFKFKAFHLGGGGALMAFLIPFFKNFFDERL